MSELEFVKQLNKVKENDLWRNYNKIHRPPTTAHFDGKKPYIENLANSIGLCNLKPFCATNLSDSILCDIEEDRSQTNADYIEIDCGTLEQFELFKGSGVDARGKTVQFILSDHTHNGGEIMKEIEFFRYVSVGCKRLTRPKQCINNNIHGLFSIIPSNNDYKMRVSLNHCVSIIFDIKPGQKAKQWLETEETEARYVCGAIGINKTGKTTIILRKNDVEGEMRFGDEIQKNSKIQIRMHRYDNYVNYQPTLTINWKNKKGQSIDRIVYNIADEFKKCDSPTAMEPPSIEPITHTYCNNCMSIDMSDMAFAVGQSNYVIYLQNENKRLREEVKRLMKENEPPQKKMKMSKINL